MICLTVSLRGLPTRTLPEAQSLLEEPYGPEGRKAATGAAEQYGSQSSIITIRMKTAVRQSLLFIACSAYLADRGRRPPLHPRLRPLYAAPP